MIYINADDYGLCPSASENILTCLRDGCINKISVFPGSDVSELKETIRQSGSQLALHVNLVEGRCLSRPEKVRLLVDEKGYFKYSFGGLLLLSLVRKKEFEKQVYEEIKAQTENWLAQMQTDELCIDSHQHTHMIPAVFRALMQVLDDKKANVKYLRIPSEPVLPYLKEPGLYFTYSPVNIAKQWLLKLLNQINKREYNKYKYPSACFFGILFSGNMNEKRVSRVLPHYLKLAEKKGMDVEVLFHPGYLEKEDVCTAENIKFSKFYYSEGRREEYLAVRNLKIQKRGQM